MNEYCIKYLSKTTDSSWTTSTEHCCIVISDTAVNAWRKLCEDKFNTQEYKLKNIKKI